MSTRTLSRTPSPTRMARTPSTGRFNSSSTPYVPAAHLVASSLLTVPQLISHFEDFCQNLRYVSDAPGLVFERLVANLNESFNAALELERDQHDTDLQKCRDGNRVLQLSNQRLEEELAELKQAASGAEDKAPEQASRSAHANPIIGTFSTNELRTWKQPRAETWRVVPFEKAYPTPPDLPVGLTCLDIGCATNPRVKVYASNIRNDRFDIHADSWGDTVHYSTNCAWLEIKADDLDFQFGTYSTHEDPPSKPPLAHNERKITFQRPYSAPPYVVVWLTGFDLGREGNFRVKTYATNVNTTGFTIHIDTWENSVLNSGIASWVAYPVDKAGVFSGHFSTLDLSSVKRSHTHNTGYEMFGRDVFTTQPRVLVAIDSLEMSNKINIRLGAGASDITAAGMKWHINTWSSEGLYSAGASYIALS